MVGIEEIREDLYLWKAGSNYILPTTEKSFVFDSSAQEIPFFQKAFDRGMRVFSLMGDNLDLSETYLGGDTGVILEIKSIEQKDGKYYVRVLGLIRAIITQFDHSQEMVKGFSIVEYEKESRVTLRKAFKQGIENLATYARMSGMHSAKRLHNKYRKLKINTFKETYELEVLLNNLAIDILDEIKDLDIDFDILLLENNR